MKIKHIKLYHYPMSRSARVKWLLHEILGEDFETETVALRQMAQFTPDFLAKNPNHGVPVLDITYDDGSQQVMYESGAMLIWLADHYGEKGFAPSIDESAARADYLQMMIFGAAWMDMKLWQTRLHQDLLPKTVRNQDFADFNKDKIKNEMEPMLIERLEAHDYICGDHFTAADIMTAHNIQWAGAYGLCRHPALKAYMQRVRARPAYALAFADAADFEG
ncbi:glutathione S-transferase family protein [Litorimonas sp. RW-G-Af-16]|uniref:glutathione S-transferase family protein n=1 Tax=Litorimonas sp. RW-G-Af-16 TaxID=3241168 RepID=UPI00390C68C9